MFSSYQSPAPFGDVRLCFLRKIPPSDGRNGNALADFRADFNQTWTAVIQVMKKYDIAQQNQEAGFIKTRWMDNTLEVNFTDSFGSSDAVKAARFKLVVNVVKGYRASTEVAKVTVYKRQLVEQDFLQGWKEVPTDGNMEQTLLYRIERLIDNDNKLKEIDKAREKQQLQSF